MCTESILSPQTAGSNGELSDDNMREALAGVGLLTSWEGQGCVGGMGL